jgi:hypothetical protein
MLERHWPSNPVVGNWLVCIENHGVSLRNVDIKAANGVRNMANSIDLWDVFELNQDSV